MNNKLITNIADKIMIKFGIDKNKAEKFAHDLANQTEAHGGNPKNEEQIEKLIDIVVRKWIEKGY